MKKMHETVIFFIILISIFIPSDLFGLGVKDEKQAAFFETAASVSEREPAPQEKVEGYFFYEELCELCHDDVNRFISIVQDELPLEEQDQYPNSIFTVNIYETAGRALYVQITEDMGIDRDMLTIPFMVLGGRVFQGYDNIKSNIREAYLTAAEDQADLILYPEAVTQKTWDPTEGDPILNLLSELVHRYNTVIGIKRGRSNSIPGSWLLQKSFPCQGSG